MGINNAAVAAHALQQQGWRVGILDVDYHGDGTLHCVKKNPNICTAYLSIHAGKDYPYMDFGDYGLEFPAGATWEIYRPILAKAISHFVEKRITALVLSLGLDTLGGDPDASDLAGCNLQVSDFREMGVAFKELNVPVILVQEGGYKLDSVPAAVSHLLTGLLQI